MFRITFKAKRLNSIGTFQIFTETVKAESIEHAIYKLYDRFDHIRVTETVRLIET